jgi:hypothetical protein
MRVPREQRGIRAGARGIRGAGAGIGRSAGAREPGEAEEAAARGHEEFGCSIPPIQPGDRFSFKSGEIQRAKISGAIVGIGDDKQAEKYVLLPRI